MKVALYGASDRYNYGDILMPIVFKEWFSKNSDCSFTFINCALTKSKMKYCGGLDTIAIKDLPEIDILVMTGGEVIGTVLSDITSNTFAIDQKLKIFIFKIVRKLIPIQFNHYLEHTYGTETPYLFAPFNDKYITIYNTVGGCMAQRSETSKNDFEKALSNIYKAKYISFRTNYDAEAFKKVSDATVQCYPDSVILLSQLYPKTKLKSLCRKPILEAIEQKYYVFQSYNLTKSELGAVSKAINYLYEKTKIKCFLLPIAYAQNHGDVQALNALHQLCMSSTIFPDQTTIFETATVIAYARAFCGTSLHGVITAISYAVPHCTWRSTHYKTIRFLKAWSSTKYIYADQNNVQEVLLALLYDEENRNMLKTTKSHLIELANENFRNIDNIFISCEKRLNNPPLEVVPPTWNEI